VATLRVDAAGLRVELTRGERIGAVRRRDVVASPTQLVDAQPVGDVWEHLRGFRAPGTGFPGRIMLGTTRYEGRKDFCVVGRHGPGLVVELRDHEFARVLVSMPSEQAAGLAASIREVAGSAR
jgi:hypothetical protein